jgi:hypothetical protein
MATSAQSSAKIMAEFGALVKLAPSMPTIGTVWVKPGSPAMISGRFGVVLVP